MRNKKSILVIISVTLLSVTEMISCTHASQAIPQVSFSKDVIPIFTASCALNSSCHLGANSTNQGVNLDSADAFNSIIAKELISTSNPSSSLLYAEVRTNEMPLPPYAPLPAAQQALILEWIKQGAANN